MTENSKRPKGCLTFIIKDSSTLFPSFTMFLHKQPLKVTRNTSACVCSENFLQFKGYAPPPRLASVLMFLLELLRRNGDSDPSLLAVPLPSLLRCIMLVNEPQGKTDNLNLK